MPPHDELVEQWQPKELRDELKAIGAGTFRQIKKGQNNNRVKLIQEWLSLQGFGLTVDRDFGPATEAAVEAYQYGEALPATGVVDAATFTLLTRPMVRALRPIDPAPADLAAAIMTYGRQHLEQRPRELEAKNLGPWVRLYMNGREGPSQLWCAGFACFILKQASQALGLPPPIKREVSCDNLANNAKAKGRFVAHNKVQQGEPQPGWLFLVRKKPGDWNHVGIVTGARKGHIWTLEGNTNDGGSRNGVSGNARVRARTTKIDFIRIE